MIVGAVVMMDDRTRWGNGGAFVYLGSTRGLSTMPAWIAQASYESGSRVFGAFVDDAGDVNGDGYDDMLVGDIGFMQGGSTVGATFLCLGSPTRADGGTPTPAAVLRPPTPLVVVPATTTPMPWDGTIQLPPPPVADPRAADAIVPRTIVIPPATQVHPTTQIGDEAT